jgi:copper chaperone CopZ
MENKEFQFKTNINCSGCVASVKPHLDNIEGIYHWDVDTTNKDKILTVHSEGITEAEVIKKVQESGYKIELFNKKTT